MDGLPALPSDLPSVSQAKLPASYEGAKTALAECERIDECVEWANKAEALASYAKQAGDETMRKMAERIQARAIRRCGELLQQIKPSKGGRPAENSGDPRPSLDGWIPGSIGVSTERPSLSGWVPGSRTEAADAVGLTEHRRKTALRVARVPEDQFHDAVEADEPASINALAQQGKLPPRTDHLSGRDPRDFRAATAMLGLLHHIARTSVDIDVGAAVRGMNGREIDDALSALLDVEDWVALVAKELRG